MHIAGIIVAFFLATSIRMIAAEGQKPVNHKSGKRQAAAMLLKNDCAGCLHYKAKLRLSGMENSIETRFTLVLGKVAATANRIKKPRLAPWRLEATQDSGEIPQALMLAKLERLLYLAGPAPQTRLENILLKYAGKTCRIWSVTVPPEMKAYAYLAEVAPGILALSYLSGTFLHGDIQSAELQLESFTMNKNVSPAQSGHNLLVTLGKLPLESAQLETDESVIVE